MALAGEDGMLGLLALVIFASVLFLLLLALFFYFLARRRRWCLFAPPAPAVSSASPARLPVTKADLERPLLSDDSGDVPSQISCSPRRNIAEESRLQSDVNIIPPVAHDSPNRRRLPTGIYVLEDDLAFGQTLKRSEIANWPAEELRHQRIGEARNALEFFGENVRHRLSPIKDKSTHQRSSLSLEVISGPSTGLQCSRQSTNPSDLPLTLGRISSSDVVLEDPGVSGKHAVINWNKDTLKWELVDTGSLNGTLLNSQPVNNPDLGLRRWSIPVEIGDGDIITLGTSSKVFVQIVPYCEHPIPFKVGMASDPMALRRGGKNLPMEDVCYCQWPLPGVKQFGLFGIFDGHGGVGAAKAACEILPKVVSSSLSNPERQEKVLSFCDASEVLKEAFFQTEAAMNHQYEGCTATALLVWADNRNEYFAQCANVGDSACVMNVGGIEIKMTEDHRISSLSERARFRERGQPLADGQGRLYGINLGRMLGDKFLKEQEPRFSPEPFISRAVHIKRASTAFALLASDGLWDVMSIKKAVQIVLQAKATGSISEGNSAENVANVVLNEARTLRTKDNTSIIFLDFDAL
ncbi:hypothetical protein Taro_015526 [Colocasia esculenta]|uniref:protein-serine/threonine phosphatase n=1 Tax=Colocasia esculenta TaxID=4460 RepID=A0A843UTG0_COLES|nr:hypothetical protein [Colocasia esculenta]